MVLKGKVIAIMLVLVISFQVVPVIARDDDPTPPTRAHPFDGGSGTENDPYQISTIEQVQAITSYYTNSFILTQDIDASDTVIWDNGSGFTPICPDTMNIYGHQGPSFNGKIDGQGYSIRYLYINRTDWENDLASGWMGFVASNSGWIIDLTLEDSYIHGVTHVGGIAGINYGLIMNCHFDGILKGTSRMGGIVGWQYPVTMENGIVSCSSSGSFTSESSSGGIVGVSEGPINDCISWSDLKCTDGEIGGIVGDQRDRSVVQDCVFRGNITTTGSGGGISAYCSGSIMRCRVENATIRGEWALGGIAGIIVAWSSLDANDLSFNGTILGREFIGGIFGKTAKAIEASDLRASAEIMATGDNIGGIVGHMGGTESTFSRMSFKGSIVGRDEVGGIAGWNEANIEFSSVDANISANESAGSRTVRPEAI